MAAITLKCPNCGGELTFEPAAQNYRCAYCGSTFTQQEVDAMTEDASAHQETAGSAAQEHLFEGSQEGEAVLYSCPSCGAQIVTDETTAATFCYYCHNPVVLEGRLSGVFLPNRIIPFEISRKEAEEKFKSYVRRKKYVPAAFLEESQIEKMAGVYYPFFSYGASVAGDFQAEGTRVRVWRDASKEYTETTVYDVRRSGTIGISELTRNALQKANRELVDNVQPFRLSAAKPFSMTYLAGFLAEKRDLEQQSFAGEVRREVSGYGKKLLEETANGYNTLRMRDSHYQIVRETWEYVLLPVWVLTYRTRGGMYYFAMNGQTGTVAGKLPVNLRKLALHCGLLFALVTGVLMIVGYLL